MESNRETYKALMDELLGTVAPLPEYRPADIAPDNGSGVIQSVLGSTTSLPVLEDFLTSHLVRELMEPVQGGMPPFVQRNPSHIVPPFNLMVIHLGDPEPPVDPGPKSQPPVSVSGTLPLPDDVDGSMDISVEVNPNDVSTDSEPAYPPA